MQIEALAALVALALALTLKPWPILTAILLAAAENGKAKATAFLAGWVTVLAMVVAVAVILLPRSDGTRSRSADAPYAGADLVLGALLAAVLVWRWRRGHAKVERTPSWVARIDTMPPLPAFVLGVVMPSYLLLAAAANQLLETGWGGARLAFMVIVFVTLASAGVALPVTMAMFRPGEADALNERCRTWLLVHRRLLRYSLGGAVAVLLMVKGLAGLVLG